MRPLSCQAALFMYSLFLLLPSITSFFATVGKTSIVVSAKHTVSRSSPSSSFAMPTTPQSDPNEKDDQIDMTLYKPLIQNFRQAAGLERIYRCASTDALGTLFETETETDGNDGDSSPLSNLPTRSPEYNILTNTNLILDLRSASERNEVNAQRWMSQVPNGPMTMIQHERNPIRKVPSPKSSEKTVLRIDVLSPSRLFKYCDENWIGQPSERIQYLWNVVFDGNKLHEMRIDALNGRGLYGLYQAILETSGEELFHALTSITTFMEGTCTSSQSGNNNTNGGNVAVHCVQGKDRTGLIIMFCQSMAGVDDEQIILDYHKSDGLKKKETMSTKDTEAGSAAAETIAQKQKGRLSREIFSGAPKEAMIQTLAFIRKRYGSVDGYLNHIGFDEDWRSRFVSAASCDNNVNKQEGVQGRTEFIQNRSRL